MNEENDLVSESLDINSSSTITKSNIEMSSETMDDTTDTEMPTSDASIAPPLPPEVEGDDNATDEGEVSDSDDGSEPQCIQMKTEDLAQYYDKSTGSNIDSSGLVYSQSREHVFVPVSRNPDESKVSAPPSSFSNVSDEFLNPSSNEEKFE